MDKARESVPPGAIIAVASVAVVALLAGIFFVFVKPSMDANKAVAEFSSPEAEAKRDPDQRKVDPQLARTIEQLKAKESHMTNATGFGRGGRRDRN